MGASSSSVGNSGVRVNGNQALYFLLASRLNPRGTRDDLEAIDSSFVQTLAFMKDIHLRSIKTAEDFRSLGLGGFDVATVDGGRAELPDSGGSVREITLENRQEFVDRAEAFKKQEFTIPVRSSAFGFISFLCCGGMCLNVSIVCPLLVHRGEGR